MSGFVGIVNGNGQPIDPALLQHMTNQMAPCGPDGQETWFDQGAGFGHARLSTTWESEHERQPISLDDTVWMTGDIRLDRRDTLLDQLRGSGCRPERTAADADLVLHAYRVWGEACLEQLSGDFAFAIWDGLRQRLFCARDQFGVVPFYYANTRHGLICSNHLNCLRLHPNISDNLNEQAIGDLLLLGMNWDVRTTSFADIQKLPPAHTLTWSEGRLRVQRYWQLPQSVDYLRYRQPADYVEQFRDLFERAISDRLRTDRAGTHLSGGMDSTSIAATAHRCMNAMHPVIDFRAYTIVYKQLLDDDEGGYAAQVAQAAGFPIEYLVAEDYIGQPPVEHPGYIYPEPLLIPNQVAEVEITRRISQYSRVLLAGFGGDPALYPSPFYWQQLLQSGQLLHFIRDALGYMRSSRRLPRLGLRSQWRQWRGNHSPAMKIPEWLNPDFVHRMQLHARLQSILTTPQPPDRYGMASAPLWSNIFAWSDPGFSGFPVKVRFPFFDLNLVRYLLSVPPVPWFEHKFLLRQAMCGVLPDTVRLRSKTPLRGPAHFSWIQQQGVQPWMTELAETPALKPYVNGNRLLHNLQNLASLTPVSYNKILPVLQFAYWLRHQ